MLFTETAQFVPDEIPPLRSNASLPPARRALRGYHRATPPHHLDQELCFWDCRGPALQPPATRRSMDDYWLSPQRHRPPGAACHWPTHNVVLLPWTTSLADVPPMRLPSYYGALRRFT